jgi:trans-aconitate methyltransferase
MSTVFGEVAGLYDKARPPYSPRVAEVTLAFAGRVPRLAADVGAGTGKGTALFAGRGFPIVCVEPDARMSSLIRLPSVTVETTSFEQWTPPAGGVDLLFAMTAWHWIDPQRRAALAAAALAPGGTLALVGRRTTFDDSALDGRIGETFRRFPPATAERPPLPSWAVPELEATAGLTDVTVWEEYDHGTVTTAAFLERLQTLSPFRRRSPQARRGLLEALREVIDAQGGVMAASTVTSLVLARREPEQ